MLNSYGPRRAVNEMITVESASVSMALSDRVRSGKDHNILVAETLIRTRNKVRSCNKEQENRMSHHAAEHRAKVIRTFITVWQTALLYV